MRLFAVTFSSVISLNTEDEQCAFRTYHRDHGGLNDLQYMHGNDNYTKTSPVFLCLLRDIIVNKELRVYVNMGKHNIFTPHFTNKILSEAKYIADNNEIKYDIPDHDVLFTTLLSSLLIKRFNVSMENVTKFLFTSYNEYKACAIYDDVVSYKIVHIDPKNASRRVYNHKKNTEFMSDIIGCSKVTGYREYEVEIFKKYVLSSTHGYDFEFNPFKFSSIGEL